MKYSKLWSIWRFFSAVDLTVKNLNRKSEMAKNKTDISEEQKELIDPTLKGYVNPPILNNYPYPTTGFSIKGQFAYE